MNQPTTGSSGIVSPNGHEVALAVELRPRGADADDAVVVARAAAGRERRRHGEHAGEHVAVARRHRIQQLDEHAFRHFVGEHGKRALRKHDEAPAARADESGVELEGRPAKVRIELEVLRDVALDERDRDRRAGGRASIRCGRAPRRRRDDRAAWRPPRRRSCRACRVASASIAIASAAAANAVSERDQEHAADRRVAGQRARRSARQRRIAEREPRKAGEDDAPRPFGQRPQRGGRQRALPGSRRGPAHGEPAGGRGIEREEGAEARGADRGERPRHAAERVERDEHPRRAGAEKPEPERVTRSPPRRAPTPRPATARSGTRA